MAWGARVREGVRRGFRGRVRRLFFEDLIAHTENFGHLTWLGQPIWQNVLDLWVIQEVIADIRPALLLETGTNRGGSALFYANLFDLLDRGRVITVDVERMHELAHPRVEFLLGGSTDEDILSRMRSAAAEADGPVVVILDSDHACSHVAPSWRSTPRWLRRGA